MSNPPIGYGHPPPEHRFKKGQSGNPKGRLPQETGALNPLGVLHAEHKVRLKGKAKTLSSNEIRLRKQVQLALEEKKVSAMIYLVKAFEEFGLIEGVVQTRQSNVVHIPSDIPGGMVTLLQDQYGWPPYSDEERAWAKRVYLKHRTEKEREADEFIGYFDDG